MSYSGKVKGFDKRKFETAKKKVFPTQAPKPMAAPKAKVAPPNSDKYHKDLKGGGYMP